MRTNPHSHILKSTGKPSQNSKEGPKSGMGCSKNTYGCYGQVSTSIWHSVLERVSKDAHFHSDIKTKMYAFGCCDLLWLKTIKASDTVRYHLRHVWRKCNRLGEMWRNRCLQGTENGSKLLWQHSEMSTVMTCLCDCWDAVKIHFCLTPLGIQLRSFSHWQAPGYKTS